MPNEIAQGAARPGAGRGLGGHGPDGRLGASGNISWRRSVCSLWQSTRDAAAGVRLVFETDLTMRYWHILRSRLRSLLFRGGREADLRDELQLHLEREIERLRANGLSPEAARSQALRTFGGVEQVKEGCRDARGIGLADALGRDVRYGARRLVRDWRFTAAAVLILGLGIGANTAIFGLVNMALFRQQQLADPERLVDIYQRVGNGGGAGANSYPAYLDMAADTSIFENTTAVLVPGGVSYRDAGTVRSGVAEYTTPSYLTVLGLRPSRGRWFDPADDSPGAAVVTVVGYQAWVRKFDSDPSLVGRTIYIQGVPATVIGIGPTGHNGTVNLGVVTDFWLPVAAVRALGGPPRVLDRRPPEAGFLVKARLRDGVSVAQAQAAMDNLGKRLAADYPREDPGGGIAVYASTDVRVHPELDVLLMALASVLLAVVGLVLAIACSNLATLLLVRGAARAREVSIRLAIGATRSQLVRHLLIESLLLSVAGGVAGCALAWWAIRSLRALELPIVVDVGLDAWVLGFAVLLSLATGMAFGLAPALKATRVDLVPTLRDDGEVRVPGRRLTLKNALVVFQVAVSVLLLGSASLFLQMVSASRTLRAGYAVDGVAILQTDARYAGYNAGEARNVYEELRRRAAAIPGVEAVALTRDMPMDTVGVAVVVEGNDPGASSSAPPIATPDTGAIWVGPGFFETLRIPLLAGRVIDERDRAGTPRVAVVSETMAREFFGSVDAVGRRFRIGPESAGWLEVVGVVRDTGTSDPQSDLVDPTPRLIYRSFEQADLLPTTVVARTSLDATGLVNAMQRELRDVDVALPILSAKTMARVLEDALAIPKAVVAFLAALGALGLTLAAIGLYAVVAFTVSRQAREIGIRMALGARSQQVVWDVARDVTVLVGLGTAAGLTLSLLAVLALRASAAPAQGIALFQPAIEPGAFLAIVTFMVIVGAAAAFGPARRAARMDPLIAIRRD
jgi:predicted permease